MCEPLAVAIHAVKRAGFEKGMKALVCGAGPIGVFLTVVLKAMGAEWVLRPPADQLDAPYPVWS